jgi:hypothetical protein
MLRVRGYRGSTGRIFRSTVQEPGVPGYLVAVLVVIVVELDAAILDA